MKKKYMSHVLSKILIYNLLDSVVIGTAVVGATGVDGVITLGKIIVCVNV